MRQAYLLGLKPMVTATAVAAVGIIIQAAAASATALTSTTELPSDVVELRDGNSVLRSDILKFNTNEAWFVDGVNTLFTDLYFFNVGINPAQRELRLEDFDHISLYQPAHNQLLFNGRSSVFGGDLNFSLQTTLQGGPRGSFYSRREDLIEVSFTGNMPLPFSLYSYIDYDLRLDGRFDNDTLTFRGNKIIQEDASGLKASLESVDRFPSAVAFDRYPFLISRLYDGTRTNLAQNSRAPFSPFLALESGAALPPTDQTLTTTDGTAALQFDDTIWPDQNLSFRFVKTIAKENNRAAIPEPTMLLGMGLTGAALALGRRP